MLSSVYVASQIFLLILGKKQALESIRFICCCIVCLYFHFHHTHTQTIFVHLVFFHFSFSIFRQHITNSNATTHHQPFNSRSDLCNVHFNLPLFQDITSQYFYCNQTKHKHVINDNSNNNDNQSKLSSDSSAGASATGTCRHSHHNLLNNIYSNGNNSNAISHIILNTLVGIIFYISCYYFYLYIPAG